MNSSKPQYSQGAPRPHPGYERDRSVAGGKASRRYRKPGWSEYKTRAYTDYHCPIGERVECETIAEAVATLERKFPHLRGAWVGPNLAGRAEREGTLL